ncbi:hypothetical protein H3N34_01040 [Photobacterium damselae subsp. damselae]|nr:hypothetical protein [Photobacterium damselae]MBA5681798.1 hypothetical protein [Photobacterium damselae subsp. damselae]
MGKPEQTAEREGYFWIADIMGNLNSAFEFLPISSFVDSYKVARALVLTQ